jgi:hypothetical protein
MSFISLFDKPYGEEIIKDFKFEKYVKGIDK